MMSIVLHHYKMLKVSGLNNSSDDHNNYIYDYIGNHSNILKQELDKWYNFSFVLRKKDRMSFKEMLQSLYKYSSSINAKGKENSPESLFMTLIFEKNKKMIFNLNDNYQQ